MPRCHSLLRHWPKRSYEEAFSHHAGYNSDRIPRSRGRDVSIVVVVEDEPSVRIAAERILRRAGHEVLSASVSEALSIIESDRSFDLLFTDMNLGNHPWGGMELTQDWLPRGLAFRFFAPAAERCRGMPGCSSWSQTSFCPNPTQPDDSFKRCSASPGAAAIVRLHEIFT
jgi:hypothetical protein